MLGRLLDLIDWILPVIGLLMIGCWIASLFED